MENVNKKKLFRFTTIGSVDNGKSTLIGRLLHDSKAIYADQYEQLKNNQNSWQTEEINLAYLTDGLKREREEGITIDVAYRYFSTPRRKFVIVDSPGHIEYTRNMITGSSNANAALILIDAQKGLDEQTKRHTIISSLLKIGHIVVCINKMDKVKYQKGVFEKIRKEYEEFTSKLNFSDVRFVPISALKGDNVVIKSGNMPWYQGPTLMYLLESMYFSSDRDLVNCRFPIQSVREKEGRKYISGTIAGGVFKNGDKIMVLPLMKITMIKNIFLYNKNIQEAFPPMSITMELADALNVRRGMIIARPNNIPVGSKILDAMLCWFDDRGILLKNKKYILFSGSKKVFCKVKEIFYKININTLHRDFEYDIIQANDIARVKLMIEDIIFYDSFYINKNTGSFILINPETNNTVAAVMIR